MTPKLSQTELTERIEELRVAAIKIKLFSSIMMSTTPEKQKAIENIRDSSQKILENLEDLEK